MIDNSSAEDDQASKYRSVKKANKMLQASVTKHKGGQQAL